MRGSASCSTAWAVAWRARAASVTLRSLDETVFSRTCTFRARLRAWDFRGCREMQGSGRVWQEGPRGRSWMGGGARAWMAGRGACEHRDAEGQGCETPGWGACPEARILAPRASRSTASCESASLPEVHVLPRPTAPGPKPWVGVLSRSECLGLREAALSRHCMSPDRPSYGVWEAGLRAKRVVTCASPSTRRGEAKTPGEAGARRSHSSFPPNTFV